jgi:hypothetical protein
MKRVSSTPLSKYIGCPRRYWYGWRELLPAIPTETSYQMAFGTIFHAFMEFRATKGRWPTKGEFAKMKGSYDDPIDAVNKFPEQYEPALRTAQYVLANHPEIIDFDDDVELEKPLDDFGLMFGDVTASGYIDVFQPSRRKISDYKTRSSLQLCPKTLDDFMGDPQQCYYGAAVARAMGWDSIIVEHINVLRPDKGGPEVFVVAVELPGWYLSGVWEIMDSEIIPDMKNMVENIENEAEVPVDRSCCFKYGKCQFYSICGADLREMEESPLAFFEDAVNFKNKAVDDDIFGGIW